MRPMSSSASPRGIAVIVGVGPRLGCSVARKFAHKGYSVAILARDLGKRAFLLSSSRPWQLSWLADEIAREAKAQVFAIRIDCGDPKSVREAFEGVLSLGSVEVLAYTACEAPPARCQPTRFTDVAVESFVRSLAESAVGAFHCAQQVSVIPGMLERGRGTIIFTGSSASIHGFAGYCELSKDSCPLRLYPLLWKVCSEGIGSVPRKRVPIIRHPHRACNHPWGRRCTKVSQWFLHRRSYLSHDSPVPTPCRIHGSSKGEQETASLDPDAVAQTYWNIHVQEKGAWTQEMDLRA
ncbi:hypothetical protein BHM03_00014914 [Ensete ventricosum]|nr:hypothetical protein BHM03_00014914 [Ensete ventricosum]